MTCATCLYYHICPHKVQTRDCDGYCIRFPEWIHKNKSTVKCGEFRPNAKKAVKKMDISKELVIFNEARKIYPGDKRGNETEFLYFQKTHKDWKDVLPLLKPAVERQLLWRKDKTKEFYPRWKGFQKWVTDRYWEFSPATGQQTLKMCHVCKQVAETRMKILANSMKTTPSPVCQRCWSKK